MPEYTEGILEMIPQAWNDLKSLKNDISNGDYRDAIQKDRYKNINPVLGKLNRELNNNSAGRSIIARARNSVLQFPIYITKGVRVTEAQIIAKLFERVYTSFVQSALASNPIIDESEANNLVFLKKFHTNMTEPEPSGIVRSFENSIPIDGIDQMIKESVIYRQKISENLVLECQILSVQDRNAKYLYKENARLINEPLSGLPYLEAPNVPGKEIKEVQGARPERTLSTSELQQAALNNGYNDAPNGGRYAWEMMLHDIRYNNRVVKFDGRRIEVRMVDREFTVPDPNDPERTIREKRQVPEAFLAMDRGKEVHWKDKVFRRPVDAPQILRDTDIKKINAMLPYTIQASFRLRNADGKLDEDVTFLIGVKTVLHLVDVNDISDDIRDIVNGNDRRLQKIRYKTGEISAMDYYFNLTQAKKDISRYMNKDKRWMNTLKRLSEYNKMYGMGKQLGTSISSMKDVPVPNGTLVMSQTDVLKIMNETGIDIGNVSTAKKMAKSLFLISVVILDIVAGNMKVLLVDQDHDWDIQSIAAIDAEVSKTDNSQLMRELNRMVNK